MIRKIYIGIADWHPNEARFTLLKEWLSTFLICDRHPSNRYEFVLILTFLSFFLPSNVGVGRWPRNRRSTSSIPLEQLATDQVQIEVPIPRTNPWRAQGMEKRWPENQVGNQRLGTESQGRQEGKQHTFYMCFCPHRVNTIDLCSIRLWWSSKIYIGIAVWYPNEARFTCTDKINRAKYVNCFSSEKYTQQMRLKVHLN